VLGFTRQLDAPFAGVALLVATAAAFPFEFRGPAGVMMSSSLPLAALICSVWLVRMLTVPSRGLYPSRAVYAAVGFMAVAVLAFAVGQYPFFPYAPAPLPAQIVELGLFVLSALLFLVVGHQIGSEQQLERLTWIFLAAGVVACIFQMVPALNFIARWTTRPGSIGSLFWTWLAALSFAQAVANRRLPIPARLALIMITGLVLYHGLFNVRSWASGWIPVVTALGAILLLKLPRLTIAAGLLVASVALVFANQLWSLLMADEAYSLMTRQEAWRVLWTIFEKNPLLGTGPANYYYYTENFPILGWYVRFISHNNYQDLLIQTGILGLAVFMWFAFECLVMLVGLLRRLPAGFSHAYVLGTSGALVGSLVAGMLGDWIVPFYYNAGVLGFRSSLLFWVFLGGGLAIRRLAAQPAPAHQPAPVPAALGARSYRRFARAH
jgi:O-antigen ligase